MPRSRTVSEDVTSPKKSIELKPAENTSFPTLPKPYFEMTAEKAKDFEAYRQDYQNYRAGHAKGAKGEVGAAMVTQSDLEARMVQLFRHLPTEQREDLEALVSNTCQEFVDSKTFCREDVSEDTIADRFRRTSMATEPSQVNEYFKDLVTDVVDDSIHTSSPQMIGHMTSALPMYTQPLAKLIVAMNQNVVKTETAKTVTFLEREALAQLHRQIYRNTDAFYEEYVQKPQCMLGLLTNGGTLANTSALWIARNKFLGPSEDGEFGGVQKEGLIRACRYHGFDNLVVMGSELMHYSMDKSADVLGLGSQGLVKIPVDTNYQVDLKLMEEKIKHFQANRTLVVAIVGICGATETGAIDPLCKMAELAGKYGIHFHCDAAWGGPCVFSRAHRPKVLGIELADTVTLDGHKQLWLPMGAGMVFLKDPSLVNHIMKTANYIIRKDSYDLGKFTIDGSRGAQALYLHANLQLLGVQGYEVLFDRTIRVAKYMARCIVRSANFELLVKPMTNILLFRWIPLSLRDKAWSNTLSKEDNDTISELNQKLQDCQKKRGLTFVSRTTIRAPKYNYTPVACLRVVIGNPLTSENDIDAVFNDLDTIIVSGVFTKDFGSSAEAIVGREDFEQQSSASGPEYWEAIWGSMTASERFVFGDNVESFFDALTTPDCFVKLPMDPYQKRVLQKIASSDAVAEEMCTPAAAA